MYHPNFHKNLTVTNKKVIFNKSCVNGERTHLFCHDVIFFFFFDICHYVTLHLDFCLTNNIKKLLNFAILSAYKSSQVKAFVTLSNYFR